MPSPHHTVSLLQLSPEVGVGEVGVGEVGVGEVGVGEVGVGEVGVGEVGDSEVGADEIGVVRDDRIAPCDAARSSSAGLLPRERAR